MTFKLLHILVAFNLLISSVLFYAEYNQFFLELLGVDYAHCHSGPNFKNGEFINNALDTDFDFTDNGREKANSLASYKAAFLMTSLRNVTYTAPCMHDGRFKTLKKIVEHYNSGVEKSSTVSPFIMPTIAKGLGLSKQDNTDLVNC